MDAQLLECGHVPTPTTHGGEVRRAMAYVASQSLLAGR